jgi:hypothetical protein
MELDFLAVVVCDASLTARRAPSVPREEMPDRWEPCAPTRADKAPNLVCVWTDPFWSGLTCARQGEPVVSGHGSSSGLSTVFRVRGRLDPLQPCTTQRLMGAWGPPSPARTMCNSVKLHFFHQTLCADRGEIGYEFLYSSAFPLALLLPCPPPAAASSSSPVVVVVDGKTAAPPLALGGAYGLFNYNYNPAISDPIAGLWLLISRTPAAAPLPSTSTTTTTTTTTTTAPHHRRQHDRPHHYHGVAATSGALLLLGNATTTVARPPIAIIMYALQGASALRI